MIAALIEDNRRLVSDLGEMKLRVAVLERLATDPATAWTARSRASTVD